MPIFRYLARRAPGSRYGDMCRAMAAAAIGKQDRFLAAAALLAAGEGDAEITRLQQVFAKEDVGKELFLARAATPTAAAKAEDLQQYLQLDTPPEQWTEDSLSWFHWPGRRS